MLVVEVLELDWVLVLVVEWVDLELGRVVVWPLRPTGGVNTSRYTNVIVNVERRLERLSPRFFAREALLRGPGPRVTSVSSLSTP